MSRTTSGAAAAGAAPASQPRRRVASVSSDENACVVCFKKVNLYSIGACDHPVCYECSTRMRILCKQTECPICRQDMPKVCPPSHLPVVGLRSARGHRLGCSRLYLTAPLTSLMSELARLAKLHPVPR